MQHNTDISSDLNNISNYTIPAITSTLSGIKEIISNNDENFDKFEDKVKHKLQRQQREIDKLYMIINTLHQFQNNPVTPSDLRRKKKNKQNINDAESAQNDNETSSQMSECEQNIIETTTETIRQNLYETTPFPSNDSIQMSPINHINNTSNDEQLFAMEELNQIDNEISRQDSILNYSMDPTLSQTTQIESTQIIPINLDSLNFPIREENSNNLTNTEDLDNLRPGQDT
jgi:hypothetical protein